MPSSFSQRNFTTNKSLSLPDSRWKSGRVNLLRNRHKNEDVHFKILSSSNLLKNFFVKNFCTLNRKFRMFPQISCPKRKSPLEEKKRNGNKLNLFNNRWWSRIMSKVYFFIKKLYVDRVYFAFFFSETMFSFNFVLQKFMLLIAYRKLSPMILLLSEYSPQQKLQKSITLALEIA